MKRATPTTQSMLAFAASARHLSFTKAAVELCVTQGAVSRQVQGLEAFVRVALFERLNPGLALTAAGRTYLPRVEAALTALETATLELLAFGGQRNQISVACHPTLATSWLLPRLPAFRRAFPKLTLNLMPPVWNEPLAQNIDIAIRFGHDVHDWPELNAQYLLGREFVAVADKKLGATTRSTHQLGQQLARQTLLHHVQVPDAWSHALSAWGVTENTVNGYAGPRFAQFSTLLQAAASGFGVAIVPLLLSSEELKSGRLVRAVDQTVTLSGGYFICYPNSRRSDELVQEVTRWLIEQADQGHQS